MQSKTIIDLLGNAYSFQFIDEHIKDNAEKLALNASKYTNIDVKAAASLIFLYQKAALKLPEHYNIRAALNFKSYEQSTSEKVAIFKSNLMESEGKSIINLTGGLGVDDWALSKKALRIDSCDTDPDIHELAVFNLKLFGINNVKRHNEDGISFLKNHPGADIIYVDPDRRPGGGRIFRMEDCTPDVISNLDLLKSKAGKVWIKLSPMADISYIRRSIPGISQLWAISLMGEVKEILVCCESAGEANQSVSCQIAAADVNSEEIDIYKKRETSETPSFSNSGKFLYEPGSAIIKAGLSADYAGFLNVSMPGISSHLFISNSKLKTFIGRSFEIINRMEYKPKQLVSQLARLGIKKANVTTRNFRESVAELRKRFKLSDGGEDYLFFTTDSEKKAWVFFCRPMRQ